MTIVVDGNVEMATAADLGNRRGEIHEARQLRNAEQEQPGLIRQALDAMVDRSPNGG